MIQFNLLPSVKIEYIKARRQKRLVALIAAGTIIGCLALLAVLISVVFVGQRLKLNNLDKSIKAAAAELRVKPDINKILTIQNQLTAIDQLHKDKPETRRMLNYIAQVTPSKISLQSFSIDFSTTAISFTGQAPSLEEVNKFVDTLKFTTISRDGEENSNADKAFSQVVLSAFGRDDKGASFTISLNFDSAIFDSEETTLQLTVPKITSTRSETERPADLFQQNSTPITEDNTP